jgi:hypothetical protein
MSLEMEILVISVLVGLGGIMEYETTAAQYEVFKKYCQKYIDFWGLHGWGVQFEYEGRDAGAKYHVMGRWVVFRFGKTSGIKPSLGKAKIDAFHEVFHVLLGRLVVMGKDRFAKEDEIDEEEEYICRVMENKVFPLIK